MTCVLMMNTIVVMSTTFDCMVRLFPEFLFLKSLINIEEDSNDNLLLPR